MEIEYALKLRGRIVKKLFDCSNQKANSPPGLFTPTQTTQQPHTASISSQSNTQSTTLRQFSNNNARSPPSSPHPSSDSDSSSFSSPDSYTSEDEALEKKERELDAKYERHLRDLLAPRDQTINLTNAIAKFEKRLVECYQEDELDES